MKKYVYHVVLEVYSDGDDAEAKEDVYDLLPKTGAMSGVTEIEKIRMYEQV